MTTTKDKLFDAMHEAVAELVAEAVEAAYREGWHEAAALPEKFTKEIVDADWLASDAKRNCD